MKSVISFSLAIVCALGLSDASAQKSGFHISKVFHIASDGGWDYLATNGNELYVSHGDHVNILNKQSGDSIGILQHTDGVHGIAFIPALNKGYTSNGRLNTLTVFDLSTHKILSQIQVGQNPDAIMYEPYSKKIISCNGNSSDLSIIDPGTDKAVATIPVGGKPETAVSDGSGNLFVNIEDKSEIVKVNLNTNAIESHWSLLPAEAPTGLAYDKATNRLFAGCESLLTVIDASGGKIVSKLPIGEGCDGVAFDPEAGLIFTSNGTGTVTVIKENAADNYQVQDNIVTKKGARTITLDESTHTLYLSMADFVKTSVPGKRPAPVPGTFQVLVLTAQK